MTMTAELSASQLEDLVREIQAGNEVVVMDKNHPVARLVPANGVPKGGARKFKMRSFPNRKVLTPVISQEEGADELFGRNHAIP